MSWIPSITVVSSSTTAARAAREATDRRMLPELAAICAAYLVAPVAGPSRKTRPRDGLAPDATRKRRRRS